MPNINHTFLISQKNQKTNTMAKLDLIEIYLWTNNQKWEMIADEIVDKNIKTDFIIRILLIYYIYL